MPIRFLCFRLIVVLCAPLSLANGQTPISLSRSQFDFHAVEGGSRMAKQVVEITSASAWTAKLGTGPANMVALNPAAGPGSGPMDIAIPGWWAAGQKPGIYRQTVTVSNSGGTAAMQVVVQIVARSNQPSFSYLSPDGPSGCEKPADLPDPAICKVPDEKPPGKFQPPRAGGSYVDPNFGAVVQVLAGPPALHGYSSPSAISAGNRYVLISEQGVVKVLELKTGKLVRQASIPFEGTMWDARNPALLYYFTGARVMQYNVDTGASRMVADFTGRFTRITAGGTGDNSKDNWLSFYAPAEQTICAMSLESASSYCANYSTVSGGPHQPDYSTIAKGIDSKSGKRYVMLMSWPAMLVFSVNQAANRLDFEYRGGESPNSSGNLDGTCDAGESCLSRPHADTFEDSSGQQYLLTSVESFEPCGFLLVSYRLNVHIRPGARVELGGGMKVIMPLFRCGGVDQWVDDHLGCAKSAPYCVVSTTYAGFNSQRADADMTPIRRTAHLSEIFVVRGDGDEIRRLVQHRSVPFKSEPAGSYWTTPRACISPDGGYVVADSNFGEPNAHRVVLVGTGFGQTRISESGVVDAAGFQPRLARRSLFSVFGDSLANCIRFFTGFPLPSEVCGTRVEVDGAASPLLHVMTGQITAVVPHTASSSQSHSVRVIRGNALEEISEVTLPAGSISDAAPAIFEYALADGTRHAAMQNSDYSLNGPESEEFGSRPLRVGETGIVYANGLGATTVEVPDDAGSPADPPASLADPVQVYVNDVLQDVTFAGLAPALSRVYQVNFVLSGATPVRAISEIFLRVRGADSLRARLSLAR